VRLCEFRVRLFPEKERHFFNTKHGILFWQIIRSGGTDESALWQHRVNARAALTHLYESFERSGWTGGITAGREREGEVAIYISQKARESRQKSHTSRNTKPRKFCLGRGILLSQRD
jgi:hypothetical protein